MTRETPGWRVEAPRSLARGAGLGRAAALGLAVALAACAAGGGVPGPAPTGAGAGFAFGRDTFAFANLVRAEHPTRDIDFANYCIVMSRAASQFFRFARFAPEAPPVSSVEYVALARAVMAIGAWKAPRPPDGRITIPGYPDLRAFSRAEEAAIKTAFGSNVPSMVHWRTWRVGFDLPEAHQAGVADELHAELAAGRPVPLMITNYPEPDLLNHVVLVYDRRVRSSVVEFLAYDPNDPGTPLRIYFEPASRAFWVGPLPYSPPGRIRAFRLYTSPLL